MLMTDVDLIEKLLTCNSESRFISSVLLCFCASVHSSWFYGGMARFISSVLLCIPVGSTVS